MHTDTLQKAASIINRRLGSPRPVFLTDQHGSLVDLILQTAEPRFRVPLLYSPNPSKDMRKARRRAYRSAIAEGHDRAKAKELSHYDLSNHINPNRYRPMRDDDERLSEAMRLYAALTAASKNPNNGKETVPLR